MRGDRCQPFHYSRLKGAPYREETASHHLPPSATVHISFHHRNSISPGPPDFEGRYAREVCDSRSDLNEQGGCGHATSITEISVPSIHPSFRSKVVCVCRLRSKTFACPIFAPIHRTNERVAACALWGSAAPRCSVRSSDLPSFSSILRRHIGKRAGSGRGSELGWVCCS